jgi:hypothetical protein
VSGPLVSKPGSTQPNCCHKSAWSTAGFTGWSISRRLATPCLAAAGTEDVRCDPGSAARGLAAGPTTGCLSAGPCPPLGVAYRGRPVQRRPSSSWHHGRRRPLPEWPRGDAGPPTSDPCSTWRPSKGASNTAQLRRSSPVPPRLHTTVSRCRWRLPLRAGRVRGGHPAHRSGQRVSRSSFQAVRFR